MAAKPAFYRPGPLTPIGHPDDTCFTAARLNDYLEHRIGIPMAKTGNVHIPDTFGPNEPCHCALTLARTVDANLDTLRYALHTSLDWHNISVGYISGDLAHRERLLTAIDHLEATLDALDNSRDECHYRTIIE